MSSMQTLWNAGYIHYEKWRFNYWSYTLKREFVDVKTMNMHQKTIVLFEKTMKIYSEAVIFSL